MAVTRPFSPAAPFRVHPKPVPKAAPPAPGWTRPACRPWHGPPTFRRRLSARSDRPVPADRNTGQHADRRAAVGPAAAGRRPALRRRSGHNRPKRASARPAADGPKTERNTYECQFFAETGGLTHESDRHRIDLAGLLTRSRPDAFPTPRGSVAEDIRNSRSITAAGLSGICTRFPFHSALRRRSGTPDPETKIAVSREKGKRQENNFRSAHRCPRKRLILPHERIRPLYGPPNTPPASATRNTSPPIAADAPTTAAAGAARPSRRTPRRSGCGTARRCSSPCGGKNEM